MTTAPILSLKEKRKLKYHPYAQAGVVKKGKGEFLVSYNTVVAVKTDRGIRCFGLHSATTRRHISWYGQEIGIPYSIFKKAYQLKAVYDYRYKCYISIDTCEIVAFEK